MRDLLKDTLQEQTMFAVTQTEPTTPRACAALVTAKTRGKQPWFGVNTKSFPSTVVGCATSVTKIKNVMGQTHDSD